MYIISPVQSIIDYPEQHHRNIRRVIMNREDQGTEKRMEGLKSLTHPALWPSLKQHLTTSLSVIKHLTDFAQELSQMYEHHAEQLQLLVANYRKKNTELRKDRNVSNCMINIWEALLQEVEADCQSHSEIASVLGRQVSRHTLERTFHRKLQARKLLAHRESLDVLITKAEETLSKCRQDYRAAYSSYLQAPNSTAALAAYLNAHNAYVTQLHSTNAMVDVFTKESLPNLLQELEEVYTDLCHTMSESVSQGAEIISNRTGAQSRRYCSMWNECKDMSAVSDTASFVRSLQIPSQPHPSHRLRLFTPPQHESDPQETQVVQLKNELVTDRLASLQVPHQFESLCDEANNLHTQIQHLEDALSTMLRIQQRSLESSLFNKANEIQEDISMKRYELRTAQLNLAAVRAHKELFAGKIDAADGGPSSSERKLSSASTASMKSKWLKAFKSLKTPPPSSGPSSAAVGSSAHQNNGSASATTSAKESDKRNGKDLNLSGSDHSFQEYTYKKITPCDVCSQVLRGHTRQGLKCRVCKLNVHLDCQERVGRCQTKSRLLRRQKSSSELETRILPTPNDEPDMFDIEAYSRRRGERSVSPGAISQASISADRQVRSRSVTFRQPPAEDHGQPNVGRRRRLFGMRSFTMFGNKSTDRASSLPETEQVQYAAGTRPFGQPLVLSSTVNSPGASSTPSPSPQSPSPRSNKKHD